MNRLIIGIISSSPNFYVPKNVPCKIWLDKNDLPVCVHRCNNGGGTYLNNKREAELTIWEEINNG